MPSRKSVWPGNAEGDRRKEPKPQAVFADVFEDPPPVQVPSTALAKALNGWPTGTAFRPRNGTKLFGAAYPAIEGRTGYAAHKTGYFIVSDSGPIFTRADVSNYWCWDNGLADEITQFIDSQTVRCRDNDANSGLNCHIQGKLNLNQWHVRQELWVIQLGNDFYTADRYKTAYTKVHIFGYDKPSNSISEMVEDGDDALVQNSRYMFRILLTKDPIRAYPTTSPIPTVRIQSNDDQPEKKHQVRYLYSVGTLDGDGNFINRETPTKIITETGTNQIDENSRDWAIQNSEHAIGNRVDTYGLLVGAGLDGAWDAPTDWDNISNATFRININGLGYQEIVIDFTDVMTMDEMAERIQTALQFYFPSATCRYSSEGTNPPHFEISSGFIKNGTVTVAYSGLTGTDSSDNLGLSSLAGASSTTPLIGRPRIIRGLTLPLVKTTASTEYQWHHDHYMIYRTQDTGPTGIPDNTKRGSVYYSHLNERGARIVNSPDEFIWNKDLRAAAAFIARRINGTIELDPGAMGGEFELADEGSVVEFEDGSRVDISEGGFIDSKTALYDDADYYLEETGWMAACIGNGKAVRITKVGTIISRYPGSDTTSYTAFTSSDERRPIWYPNGSKDFIKRVINSDTFEVYQNFDIDIAGITYEPKYRNYCDALPDEQLYTRASAWMCKNRFMREILPSNSIIKQPGFIVAAARGAKELRYCPLESSYKQFLGYHVREHQTIKLEDVIERLIGFTNRYSALCKGSIYSGATNNSIEYTIPETLQIIWILSGVDKVSSVGLISYGSLEWVEDDLVRFVTNTNEVRDFNGIQFRSDQYGPIDYSEDKATGLSRFKNSLRAAFKEFNSRYSRGVGYIIWWKENPAFTAPSRTPSVSASPSPEEENTLFTDYWNVFAHSPSISESSSGSASESPSLSFSPSHSASPSQSKSTSASESASTSPSSSPSPGLRTQIDDNFDSGSYDPWWNIEYTSAFGLVQYPPASGNYVSVLGYYDAHDLTPDGEWIEGDFKLDFEFVFGSDQLGKTDVVFVILDSSYLPVAMMRYEGNKVIWGADEAAITPTPYGSFWGRIERNGGVINAYYSTDDRASWTPFPTTEAFSGEFYIVIAGASKNGFGQFDFEADDGFPYPL